jgi:FimV-like protein
MRFVWRKHSEVSTRLYERYRTRPYTYFLDQNTSRLSRSLLTDAQAIFRGVLAPLLDAGVRSVVTLFILGFLLYLDPVAALASAAVLGAAYGLLWRSIRTGQERIGREQIERAGMRYKLAAEGFDGVKELKVLGREDHMVRRFRRVTRRYSDITVGFELAARLPRNLMEVVAYGGILLVAVYLIVSREGLGQALPLISAFGFAGYKLMPALQGVFADLHQVNFNSAALDGLHEDLFGGEGAEVEPAAAPAESEEVFSDDTTQEADVYLAYGLYDQAEELLTQALSTSPDNVHYTGKLLETYFAAGKKGEFQTLADKLHTSLGGRSSRIWDKTVAMGKEIAPDNALFRQADTGGLNVSDFAPAKPETADLDLSEPQGATTPDIAFEEESGGAASTTTDFDLDLGEADEGSGFGGDDLEQASGASEGSESELEFDLDAGDDEDVGSELNIDFNAEELGLDADSEPAVELDADTDSGSEEPAIELDTDTDTNSEAPAIELDTDTDSGTADDTDLDVDDMDATVAMDLSFNLDDEKESAGQAGSGDEELDAIELDSDMDLGDVSDMDAGESVDFDADAGDDLISELDYSDDDSPQEASSDTEFEISDDDDTIIDADLDDDTLSGDSDFDEVATKLDLAKAYMDMGDTDGASSTLEEVMAEGSDDQRREAEELLDQIN